MRYNIAAGHRARTKFEYGTRKIRRGWLTAITAALVLVTCISSCTIHNALLVADFEHVTVGMQRQAVTRVLGVPRYTRHCAAPGPFRPWQRPDCVETYVYPSWGQPFLPSVWVVWFDGEGTIGKYRFVSWQPALLALVARMSTCLHQT